MKENVTRIKNNLDETEFGQCDELIKNEVDKRKYANEGKKSLEINDR